MKYRFMFKYFTVLLLIYQTFAYPALECPKKYSINLMWINRDQASKDQPYLYPIAADNGSRYVDTLIQWAKKNPEANINFWFDSTLVSDSAVKATKEQIAIEAAKVREAIAPINLKDIRWTEQVKQAPELFTQYIPVYWRADFARVVIAKEGIEQDPDSCFVYADLDVQPIPKNNLFDRESLGLLEEHSFVMAYESNLVKFENSFQMFVYNDQLIEAMQTALIDVNVSRARSFLKELEERKDPASVLSNPSIWKSQETSFQENVFYTYPLMRAYLDQLRGKGRLILPDEVELKDYKALGDLDARILVGKSSAISHLSRFPMPTKNVSIPCSTSKQREFAR